MESIWGFFLTVAQVRIGTSILGTCSLTCFVRESWSIAVSGSLNRWYVIYNHPVGPVGNLYHLYTTYSPCQLGDYISPIPPIKGTRNNYWFQASLLTFKALPWPLRHLRAPLPLCESLGVVPLKRRRTMNAAGFQPAVFLVRCFMGWILETYVFWQTKLTILVDFKSLIFHLR